MDGCNMTVGDLKYYLQITKQNIAGMKDSDKITDVPEEDCTYPYLVTRDGCYPLFEVDIYNKEIEKPITMKQIRKAMRR